MKRQRLSLRSVSKSSWMVAALVLLMTGFAHAADSASPAVAEQTPEQLIRHTADSVLALIDSSQSYAKEDTERFYREVEALLDPVVDFTGFARSVMSVHYQDATPEQRERFAETFKWGLVRTYALALTEFRDGEVVVLPPDRPPRNPKRQTVTMEIHTKAGEVYPVLYSMGQSSDGSWRLRNIIINGVNMGLTYRSQFNSAVNDPKYGGNLDKVIDAWADMLAADTPGTGSAAQPAGAADPGQEA
ncbi:MAG: ABC transporter substrate-binding protein [Pseudomonadales bacterium]